jgi:hypothetical protein
MPAALLYATQILGILPQLISAGSSVVDLVNHGNAALKSMQDDKRDPTSAEWDELNAKIKALQDELHS